MQSGEWRCNRCSQFYAQEAKEAKPRFSINSLESGQWIRHLPHKSILRGWFFGGELRQQFFRVATCPQRFFNRLVFKSIKQSFHLKCSVDGVFVITESVTCNQTTQSSIFNCLLSRGNNKKIPCSCWLANSVFCRSVSLGLLDSIVSCG